MAALVSANPGVSSMNIFPKVGCSYGLPFGKSFGSLVTDSPLPVLANLALKIELMNVLFPAPLFPTIT